LILALGLLSTSSAGQEPVLPDPGPRFTGRWIVHIEHDPAEHRADLREIARLRRTRDRAGLAAFVQAASERRAATRTRAAALVRGHGAEIVAENWLVNTLGVQGADQALLEALLALPEVGLLQPDQWAHAQMEIATDASHHNSDLANTLAAPGGGKVDGHGVTIAIIDTGIDADMSGSGRPHAAFYPDGNPGSPTGGGIAGSRLQSSESYSITVVPPEDIHGHGTRMASIAAGAEFNAQPEIDDAPAFAAALRSYKISDDALGALASFLAMDAAFQAILTDPDVVVANMSYDGSVPLSLSPNPAIESAALADVFVSLSAGNVGSDLAFAHGCYNALVVGASHVDSKQPLVLPGFVTSAIGPLPGGRVYPHILAVGEALTCAKLDDEAGAIDSFGTSGAAALVAGTAALVRQVDPTLTQLEVKALLLNSSEDTFLGNPKASGYGYLRSDRAVEEALAGNVVSDSILTGQVKSHSVELTAGAAAAFTLAWSHEGPTEPTIDDLDLRVRDPLGNVVAWSASLVDNVEQIRFTASLPGFYKVQILPIAFDGDGAATYALAGVKSPSSDPGSCTFGAPVVLEQFPSAVPALVQGSDPSGGVATSANDVILIGCNFSGATALTLAGTPVPFTKIDDNTLQFALGVPPGLGALPLTITSTSGALNTTLSVVHAPNVLNASGNIVGGTLNLAVGGKPGDIVGLAFSPFFEPTLVPGLFAVDIGKGGASLFPFKVDIFNAANGVQEYTYTGLSGIFGQFIYLQGVVLDGITLAAPWASTNPVTTIYTH
jgi:hypothetical protein